MDGRLAKGLISTHVILAYETIEIKGKETPRNSSDVNLNCMNSQASFPPPWCGKGFRDRFRTLCGWVDGYGRI